MLVQENSTLAIKKVKLSTLQSYVGVGESSATETAPVGFWQLNELNGLVAQNLGSGMSNGNHNNVALGQLPLAKGSINSAFFNGSSSNVSFANTLLNANAGISIECLVNLASVNLKGSFVKVGSVGIGIGLGVGGSTQDDTGNNLIGLSECITWKPTNTKIGIRTHHIGLVFKGSTTKEWLFYLDGFLATTLSSQNIFKPGNTGSIGTDDNARYVNSLIDEVAIQNKVLPAHRWLAHANTVIY